MKDIDLNDIADTLLIVDKRTIDHLFSLDNPADCVALYMFFYKTAKWQQTKSIKANDVYIRKCLGWGAKRVTTTKELLQDAGLIRKVARRKNGKITGHFIEVAYLLHQNTPNPLVEETTCGQRETYTNKEYIKYSSNNNLIIDTKVSMAETAVEKPARSARSLEIDEAFQVWEEVMGYPLQQNTTDRRSINALLNRKEMTMEKLRMLVELVRRSHADKYKRFSITCYTDLLYKTNDLLAWAHEKAAQHQTNSKVEEV